jgi:hypothetical protein
MRYLIALALGLPVLAACTSVDNIQEQYSDGFRVQGVGVVQAKPDIASLTLGIEA